MKNWFTIRNNSGSIDLSIHDEIGTWGVTAFDFLYELDAHKNATTINLSINSPGGSVIDGLAIYNALKKHPARVNANVVALAGSAASFILMAADHATMPENSILFIHKAQGMAQGEADDFREVADIMDMYETMIVNIYMSKANISENEIRDLMAKSTHIKPTDALTYGLIDQVGDAIDIAAKMGGYEKYTGIPQEINIGNIETIRDYERTLRDAGLSKKLAESLSSRVKGGFLGEPATDLDALNTMGEGLGKLNALMQNSGKIFH